MPAWLGVKIGVVALVLLVAAAGGVDAAGRHADPWSWVMYRFAHWDSNLYAAIAIRGYPPAHYPHGYYSFLPGFPWLIRTLGRALHVEVRWAALMVVTVSSLVCVVLLDRLVRDMTGSAAGARWGVLAFLIGPMAIFYTVDYTEAPFLALALGAWLAGRRHAWVTAGLLAGLASTLRITGPLVAAGLLVMYISTRRDHRTTLGPNVLALGIGPGFFAGYLVWLHARTGRWDTWTLAQRHGFGRATTWPWVGFADAVHKLAVASSWHLAVVRSLEILAPVAAWALAGVLGLRRWWPETAYAALCAASMSFSTIYDSSPRYLSAVFPVYVVAGPALARARTPQRVVTITGSALLCAFASTGWALQWWVA